MPDHLNRESGFLFLVTGQVVSLQSRLQTEAKQVLPRVVMKEWPLHNISLNDS